jgi:hypothetical protein
VLLGEPNLHPAHSGLTEEAWQQLQSLLQPLSTPPADRDVAKLRLTPLHRERRQPEAAQPTRARQLHRDLWKRYCLREIMKLATSRNQLDDDHKIALLQFARNRQEVLQVITGAHPGTTTGSQTCRRQHQQMALVQRQL